MVYVDELFLLNFLLDDLLLILTARLAGVFAPRRRLLLAAALAAIIVNLVKNRRSGKSSCGCGCADCPMSAGCHQKK